MAKPVSSMTAEELDAAIAAHPDNAKPVSAMSAEELDAAIAAHPDSQTPPSTAPKTPGMLTHEGKQAMIEHGLFGDIPVLKKFQDWVRGDQPTGEPERTPSGMLTPKAKQEMIVGGGRNEVANTIPTSPAGIGATLAIPPAIKQLGRGVQALKPLAGRMLPGATPVLQQEAATGAKAIVEGAGPKEASEGLYAQAAKYNPHIQTEGFGNTIDELIKKEERLVPSLRHGELYKQLQELQEQVKNGTMEFQTVRDTLKRLRGLSASSSSPEIAGLYSRLRGSLLDSMDAHADATGSMTVPDYARTTLKKANASYRQEMAQDEFESLFNRKTNPIQGDAGTDTRTLTEQGRTGIIKELRDDKNGYFKGYSDKQKADLEQSLWGLGKIPKHKQGTDNLIGTVIGETVGRASGVPVVGGITGYSVSAVLGKAMSTDKGRAFILRSQKEFGPTWLEKPVVQNGLRLVTAEASNSPAVKQ